MNEVDLVVMFIFSGAMFVFGIIIGSIAAFKSISNEDKEKTMEKKVDDLLRKVGEINENRKK